MNRTKALQQLLATTQWDIIIIGGGATGLGCAVDAASRGYKTLLLEKSDFAKGTSSRATKLVHGGVRYLQQGNIRLVREALLERGRLLKNAPHVCHPLPFILPFYSYWQKWYYSAGLWLYEWLSGTLSLGKTSLLVQQAALKCLPDLNPAKLTGGILYYDGQFDDSRLAINLAQTAEEQGATVINYMPVTGFKKTAGKITAVMATDSCTNITYELAASVVINATGVFADELLQLAEGHTQQTITPSQGIHLVVAPHFFKGSTALMIPKTDDGRVLFAIPWYGKVLVGTTDTAVQDISQEPRALPTEVDFVINHFNRYASTAIGYADVLSVFAGLRPLAKSSGTKKTAVMPRDHHIEVLPSGMVHVTGGKWTTYRSMAQHAVDKALKPGGLPMLACTTTQLKIHGYSTQKTATHWDVYGTDAAAIKAMIVNDAFLGNTIHPHYPYTCAEVKWMVIHEMAITVEDVLARRMRLLFVDAKAAMEAAPTVAAIMAAQSGKDDEWVAMQIDKFNKLAAGYLLPQHY
jgi:glycerol-3-phosphate dehydrogenase